MSMIDLQLPGILREHMSSRVAHDEFTDESEYLRCLIAQDLSRVERLRAAIQEGIDSGISPLTFEEIIEKARRRAISGE